MRFDGRSKLRDHDEKHQIEVTQGRSKSERLQRLWRKLQDSRL